MEKQIIRTPSAIGDLIVTLSDKTENGNVVKEARYRIRVLDQDGRVMNALEGDLVPHLSQAEITALIAFMNSIRALAIAKVL